MAIQSFDVFCADCRQAYTQRCSAPPKICGACGSDFIAVREDRCPVRSEITGERCIKRRDHLNAHQWRNRPE